MASEINLTKFQAIRALVGTRWGTEILLIGYSAGWLVTNALKADWIGAAIALVFGVWRYWKLTKLVNRGD